MTAEKTTDANAYQDRELDEELAEVLIAISVITKRLARKINENLRKTEVTKHGTDQVQTLWPGRSDNQS